MHSYSAFIWKISSKNLLIFIKKSNNVGVGRGVATRSAQMVWPVMTVTATNFEGFTRQQFCKNVQIREFSKLLPQNLSQYRPHYLSPSCAHTPFHTHIIWLFDDFLLKKAGFFPNESRARTHTYWWHTYKYLFYVYQVWHLESWWFPHFKGLYNC